MTALIYESLPDTTATGAAATVDAAIVSRASVRAFLPTPVPREVIEDILRVAARSPSGTNTQPWNVWVLTGETKRTLSQKLQAAHDDPVVAATHIEDYAYYPTQWQSPFIERRRNYIASLISGALNSVAILAVAR